jgi:hypothetical protein
MNRPLYRVNLLWDFIEIVMEKFHQADPISSDIDP